MQKRKDLLGNHINGGSFSLCPVFFHYWVLVGIGLFPRVPLSRLLCCVCVLPVPWNHCEILLLLSPPLSCCINLNCAISWVKILESFVPHCALTLFIFLLSGKRLLLLSRIGFIWSFMCSQESLHDLKC